MINPVWARALKSSSAPESARKNLDLLAATSALPALQSASEEQAGVLCALLGGSDALTALLAARPDWVAALDPEELRHPRREQGLRREVESWLPALLKSRDPSAAYARLRQFKQKEMLRIAARDLARLGKLSEIVREISEVADICLDAVLRLCRAQFLDRLGWPYHQDANGRWHETEFCVLALGKLGGQELNYSSDVDVMFLYSQEGTVFKTAPTGGTQAGLGPSSRQFFKRLAESFIAEVSRMTADGMLYRIDLRLRPEGDSGPLAQPLAGYENYYAQWGQTWERMMLIKARCSAGSAALAGEFMEMIQPFRYPRSLGEGVLGEIAAIKERIEREVVKAGELERNVKLGRGGIREIEFVAQTMQLLNAGRIPFLQGGQTLTALEKLADYEILPAADSKALAEAYVFLRDVEHRLQMRENLQTHVIPESAGARERLAALMGFDSVSKFEEARARHTESVRRVYDSVLRSGKPAARTEFPPQFQGFEEQWKNILAAHSFRQVDHSLKLVGEFIQGPGYVHVSRRTENLAAQLLARFLAMCPKAGRPAASQEKTGATVLSDPDRVITRMDSFISAYGARATLFETWNTYPSIFELLARLFDRSEYLAAAAIRTPDLVDELVISGRLRQRKTAAEILDDLRHGVGDADQRHWLRRYYQAEQMRIALRDILDLADFEQNLVEYSALSDACLQYALEVVLRRHKLKKSPLVIIGLGKLGGSEINYGSDLDLLFIADRPAKDLPKLQPLAVEIMDLLSAQTEDGIVFKTDARLRPDGGKGLLVNTLGAFEEYYRLRAQLWEIQSITRTRPVAGNMELGREFQNLAAALTDFRKENVAAGFPSIDCKLSGKKTQGQNTGLAAYAGDWKRRIGRMRQRIEKERTPPGRDALAIKTGYGGLMDAEFIAQAFCLENGWREANTLRALERARDSKVLPAKDASQLIGNYRQLRLVEGILRRWSFEGETVLPVEDAPYYRVSVRCGFATPHEFRQALKDWRQAIREIYDRVFRKPALPRTRLRRVTAARQGR